MTAPISHHHFRDALAHFASGVTAVAVFTPSGPVGMAVSAFSSLSLAPPLVLICVGKKASAYADVLAADRFGVSVLGEAQARLVEQLARPAAERFRDVPLREGPSVPLIEGALVQLECQRYATHDGGDHTILIGEVVDSALGTGGPLVHYARKVGRFVT